MSITVILNNIALIVLGTLPSAIHYITVLCIHNVCAVLFSKVIRGVFFDIVFGYLKQSEVYKDIINHCFMIKCNRMICN